MPDENLSSSPESGGASPEAPVTGDSIRDDINAAIEKIETRDAPPAAAGERPQAADPASATDRARGPDGRFVAQPEAPKAPTKPADAPKPAPTTPDPSKPALEQPKPPSQAPAPSAPKKDPAAPAPAALKAPTSWKPLAREHWAKLPPEVQQEVTRREVEVGRSLQESARARDALSHVQQVIGPYAHNIQASGADAITCMQNLFNADNTLRHGSISEKAQLVASIIKNFGVDVNVLDGLLSGQQVAPDPNAALAEQLRREMAAQLKPVMGFFNQMQGQRSAAMQQIQQSAASDVEAFAADPAHEFFEDVRNEMGDLMDLHAQRGHSMSLQEAYDRAIMMHPQVREIVAKRAEAERANSAAQAAQRARRAAASLTSSPAPAGAGPGPAGDDRRAALEAAWDQSSNG